jgi:quinol monooxygenase YgiN
MSRLGCMALLATLAIGCGDSTGGGGDAGGSSPGGANAGGAGGAAPSGPSEAELYGCDEVGFGDVIELGGPGYNPVDGIIGEPQAEYVVHATMLYWKADQQEAFYDLAVELIAQLNETEGLLAYALGTDETCRTARSIGIWRSEEDLYAFVTTGAHAKAMGLTNELSWSGKATHYSVAAGELDTVDWESQRVALEDVEPSAIYNDAP